MSRLFRAALAFLPFLIGLLVGGCASSSLYSWGPYEESVYETCSDFKGSSLQEQIAALAEHAQRCAASGRKSPPGLHAHLGYLHTLAGDAQSAREHLETEKRLFPESAKFVDGMLKRMKS
jgi:hypothetical protein